MRHFPSLLCVLAILVFMIGCQEPQPCATVEQAPETYSETEAAKAEPIVIDNTNKAFKTEGTWYDAWTGKDHKGGLLWCYADTTASAKAIWTPDIKVAGNYEVFMWHGDDPNYDHANNAQITINYSGGSKTVTVDQQKNIGKWNSLGTYKFAKGTKGNIVLNNKANGNVVADAVKLVCKGK
ncbi:MAG: hypothetical protein JSV03_06055 [Planctomycetota bacterium]|nr:MAG: hypothetical protein JSV03_06055 [Planctomycetota bacterium]